MGVHLLGFHWGSQRLLYCLRLREKRNIVKSKVNPIQFIFEQLNKANANDYWGEVNSMVKPYDFLHRP